MSLDALIYVKQLKPAPNGEVITPAERATLWYLADDHPSNGVAVQRPSYDLAEHVGVTPEELMAIYAELVRKGVFYTSFVPEKPLSATGPDVFTTEYFFTNPSLTDAYRSQGKG